MVGMGVSRKGGEYKKISDSGVIGGGHTHIRRYAYFKEGEKDG